MANPLPNDPGGTEMGRAPRRMSLVNLNGDPSTLENEMEAQFNPTELDEKIAVNYNRLAIMGMSHKGLQYQQTDNMTWDFELAFRAFDNVGNRLPYLRFARNFLMSVCVPRRGSADVTGGAPPRLLFIWPNMITLTAVITSLAFKHTFMGQDGTFYHSAAKITLEEMRDVRMFSEDILETGTQRGSR